MYDDILDTFWYIDVNKFIGFVKLKFNNIFSFFPNISIIYFVFVKYFWSAAGHLDPQTDFIENSFIGSDQIIYLI